MRSYIGLCFYSACVKLQRMEGNPILKLMLFVIVNVLLMELWIYYDVSFWFLNFQVHDMYTYLVSSTY